MRSLNGKMAQLCQKLVVAEGDKAGRLLSAGAVSQIARALPLNLTTLFHYSLVNA